MSFRESIQWLVHAPAAAFGLLGSAAVRHHASGPAASPASVLNFGLAPLPATGAAVDLAQAIPALLNDAARFARERGCRLEFAVPSHLAVQASPGALSRALRGILERAIAQAPGGRVLVTARQDAGRVRIAVCDDGCGVEAALQEAWLREPIQLLADQGGTLRVAPRPGQGTVVTVQLPVTASVQPVARPNEALASN